jgi:2-oxoglutarate dehydrogenase E1 component
MAKRKIENRNDVSLIRFEQLYPFDQEKLGQILSNYGQWKSFIWAQEEPINMGPWPYLSSFLQSFLPKGAQLMCIARERSAAPATGFYARHKQEQANLIHQVFNS